MADDATHGRSRTRGLCAKSFRIFRMNPDAGGRRVHFVAFFLPACTSPLHALRDAESSIVQEKRKRYQEASNNVADWKLETARFK